jgi:uncharacterized membrane protein
MGSLTDRSDQSGGSGATNEGDGADRADDAANSAVPVREAEHPDSHIHGDRGAIDAPSLIGGGKGVSIERTLSYESPLPPPEAMRDYEAIQPGAFDRILKLTEQQQTHRINEEEREGTHRRAVVRRDQAAGIADQKRGMYLGTLVLGLVILGGITCAALNQPWPAAVLAAGAAGIIAIFGWRQRRGNAGEQSRP